MVLFIQSRNITSICKKNITFLTRNLAASSTLTLSFADVKNHPENPFSLQNSSIDEGFFTGPSGSKSHYKEKYAALYTN